MAALGTFDFHSQKKKRATRLHAFLLQVDEELDEYDEDETRARKWVSVDQCSELLQREEMVAVFKAAVKEMESMS